MADHLRFRERKSGVSFDRNYHGGKKRGTVPCASGSLTVEASAAVPLFFLCMVTLICLMDLYGQIAAKTASLMTKAERLATAAGMTGECVVPVIDLKDPVIYRPRWFPVNGAQITAACRGRVRVWCGRDPDDSDAEDEEPDDEMVYLTAYGSVYHTDACCSHLNLSIQCVSSAEAAGRRNSSGHKYHRCEKCAAYAKQSGMVYLTEYGDRYHCSPDCSGLTRSVKLVPLSETDGMRQCSKCAAEEAKKKAAAEVKTESAGQRERK